VSDAIVEDFGDFSGACVARVIQIQVVELHDAVHASACYEFMIESVNLQTHHPEVCEFIFYDFLVFDHVEHVNTTVASHSS